MQGNPISIVDVRIPFWRLVVLLIKLSAAAIPAAIMVVILYFALYVAGLFVMVGLSRLGLLY